MKKPPFPSPLYLFPLEIHQFLHVYRTGESWKPQFTIVAFSPNYNIHYREAEDCTTADPHHGRHFTLNLQPEKNFPSQCCTHTPEIPILTCIHLQTAETLNIAIPIASLSKLPLTILISFSGCQRKPHQWQIQPWRFPCPPFTSCPFHLKPFCLPSILPCFISPTINHFSPNTITGPGTFQEAKCIYRHHVDYNSYTSLLLILCTLRAPIIRELKLSLCSPLRFKFISVGSCHSLGRCSC